MNLQITVTGELNGENIEFDKVAVGCFEEYIKDQGYSWCKFKKFKVKSLTLYDFDGETIMDYIDFSGIHSPDLNETFIETINNLFEIENIWNELSQDEANKFLAIEEIKDNYDIGYRFKLNYFNFVDSILNNADYNSYFTYYGFMSFEDIAREYVDDCFDIPDNLKKYFDYYAMGEDIKYEDSYISTEFGALRCEF